MPTLPLSEPSAAYPSTVGARTITVRNSGGDYTPAQLATAFSDAASDRASNSRTNIIEIDSAVDYTFTAVQSIPISANPGSKWIIVRSSAYASLPARDTKVTVADAANMPKLRQSTANEAVINCANGDGTNVVNMWWFHGLEITTTHTNTVPDAIIALGSTSQATLARIPDTLTIDRCYVHGIVGNYSAVVSRGVGLHCKTGVVVDSRISDIHNSGQDAQGILGGAGPGPYLVQNNYLEASGENVLFGGFDSAITNLIPSDITVRKNTFSKKLEWKFDEEQYGGTQGGVKNIFELKNGRRVLIEGNYFSRCWTDGQQGWCFDLTPRNQDGASSWSEVTDITIRHNVIANVNQVFDLLATDDNNPSGNLDSVQVYNNLFIGLNTARWGAAGNIFVTLQGRVGHVGPNNFSVTHNTGFPYDETGKFQATDLTSTTGWVFKDNLFGHGAYGWFGSGLGEGNNALAQFSGIDFTKNVIIGGTSSVYNNYAGNFFPATNSDVGFNDFAAGNYRLLSTSAYHNAASDGTDIGADLDTIQAACGLTLPITDDLPPWVTNVAATPGSTSCVITFTTDELADTQIEYGTSTSYGHTTTLADNAPRVTSHSATLTGLSASTLYHYRVLSSDAAGNQTVGRDRTFTTANSGGMSPSPSISPSASVSPSSSASRSVSPSASVSPSSSVSRSPSPSTSPSPSVSPSASVSPSSSASRSVSPSSSQSPSPSMSPSASVSPSSSISASVSPSASVSRSVSPSASNSPSPSPSASPSPSSSPSPSVSPSVSASVSPSVSASVSRSQSASASASPSPSPSPEPPFVVDLTSVPYNGIASGRAVVDLV